MANHVFPGALERILAATRPLRPGSWDHAVRWLEERAKDMDTLIDEIEWCWP